MLCDLLRDVKPGGGGAYRSQLVAEVGGDGLEPGRELHQANTTGARVEISEGATGQFRFNLFAGNGEIVLSSESYTTRAAAWNGAMACQDAAASEGAYTVQVATDGSYYFTLAAANGEIVGVSELYTSRAAAESGIASVRSVLSTLDLI